jgi:hypothetical protein
MMESVSQISKDVSSILLVYNQTPSSTRSLTQYDHMYLVILTIYKIRYIRGESKALK